MNRKHVYPVPPRDILKKVLPNLPMIPTLKLKLIDPSIAKVPTKGSVGAAAYDLYSAERQIINPGETAIIGTGLIPEIPQDFYLAIYPRSGISSKGILLSNSPGTIDSDYRGEIKIILTNASESSYKVNIGDRLAQCVLRKEEPFNIMIVDEVSKTKRGDGGLGSTGV